MSCSGGRQNRLPDRGPLTLPIDGVDSKGCVVSYNIKTLFWSRCRSIAGENHTRLGDNMALHHCHTSLGCACCHHCTHMLLLVRNICQSPSSVNFGLVWSTTATQAPILHLLPPLHPRAACGLYMPAESQQRRLWRWLVQFAALQRKPRLRLLPPLHPRAACAVQLSPVLQ